MKKLILCLIVVLTTSAPSLSQGYPVGDWFCWDDIEYRATGSGDVEMRTCTTCRDENMMIQPPNCGTWVPTDETLADVNKGVATNYSKIRCSECKSGVRYCYNGNITWTEMCDDDPIIIDIPDDDDTDDECNDDDACLYG